MYILGISCFYHDSAAALIKDGEIIAAAQEERFTRKKHDSDFPSNAVGYCLSDSGHRREGPGSTWHSTTSRSSNSSALWRPTLRTTPKGISSFLMAMPLWLKEKLWMPSLIREKIGPDIPILYHRPP